MKKFKYIFGNPPFQDNESKGKTQHKIWPTFTMKAVNEWLEDCGELFWISPYSWGSPSSKILKLLKENRLDNLNLDTSSYFPNIGSTFSHYKLTKAPSLSKTKVEKDGRKFTMSFSDAFYIPNDVCDISMKIHSKVMFANDSVFKLEYDYVTCHNVIRHAKKLLEKKIEKAKDSISKDIDKELLSEKSLSRKIDRLRALIESRSDVDISLSESKTGEHVYPVFHTNNKTWYSSKRQSFAGKKKVMWSRSGYVKSFYDSGILGGTDMAYYILVDSDVEGQRLVDFLSSDLMTYVFKTAKWSGFGNELVFASIPKIDLSSDKTDSDYYKIFNISKAEQDYIQEFLNPPKSKKKPKTTAETKTTQRVKKHGEVFTPRELVLELMSLLPDNEWKNRESTFLDPACGNGNFIVEILTKRLNSGIPPEIAVETLYGIDILPDNISETKDRMRKALSDKGHDPDEFSHIIDSNIVVSNSLEKNMEEIFSF